MTKLVLAAMAALASLLVAAGPADARSRSAAQPAFEEEVTYQPRARRAARHARYHAAPRATSRRKARRAAIAQRTPTVRRSARRGSAQRGRAAPVRSANVGGGATGIASFYWQGHTTASGARFNPEGMTAAHRTLPFGTRVRVTHLGNGRSVVVTINDRGPFIGGRIIDLSRGAAGVLGMHGQGLANVRMEVIGR